LYRSPPYQQPLVVPTLTVLKLKAPSYFVAPWKGTLEPIPEPPNVEAWMSLNDLSDHYPVHGKFEFPYNSQPVIPDGCKFDSDCHFEIAHCYCTGPGCTLDGKHVNGYDLGYKNKVNQNCKYDVWALQCKCV